MSGAPRDNAVALASRLNFQKPDGTIVDSRIAGRAMSDVFRGSEPSEGDQAALGVGRMARGSTDAVRRRAAATRSRRAGRPLLGPGGAQRDKDLQATLGAG